MAHLNQCDGRSYLAFFARSLRPRTTERPLGDSRRDVRLPHFRATEHTVSLGEGFRGPRRAFRNNVSFLQDGGIRRLRYEGFRDGEFQRG